MKSEFKKTNESIETLINGVKIKLVDRIKDLPDNKKIKRLSKRCYTINSKDLSGGLNLSAFYYDFKAQYQYIVDLIEGSTINRIESVLVEIITTGRCKDKVYSKTKTFNPEVVEHLKAIYYA